MIGFSKEDINTCLGQAGTLVRKASSRPPLGKPVLCEGIEEPDVCWTGLFENTIPYSLPKVP